MTSFHRFGIVLAVIAGFGHDRAAAQTPAPASAATRLKLIAEEPQVRVSQASPTSTNPPVPPAPEPPSQPVVEPKANDPTMPGPAIRDLLNNETPNAPGPSPTIPSLRLRARVIVHGKPPAALIEIGVPSNRGQVGGPPAAAGAIRSVGVFRAVREGEEFVIPEFDATSPIRVVKLSATEAVLEFVNRKLQVRLD